MIRNALKAVAAIALCAALTTFATTGWADGGLTKEQQAAVEKLIRETLTKNPEIVRDALIALEQKQEQAQQQMVQKGIADNADMLFREKDALVAGNPNGNVTVVEFFDYNCGYCRRATEHIVKLVESDKNVRVVFKEFPIFGDKSEAASKAAIAAQKQGKYFEFHRAMLQTPGTANLDKALAVAKKLGLDIEKLREDMKDPSVQAHLDETKELANKLGIQGTPFYLVGDRVIPGAPEDLYDQFVHEVATVRKDGCLQAKVC